MGDQTSSEENVRSPMGARYNPRAPKRREFSLRSQSKELSKIVDIIVGPDEQVYPVHKGVFCEQSQFFAAAFGGHFLESQTQVLKLPEIDPKNFQHVYLWMYSQRLEHEEYFYKDGKPTYFALLDLYSVADHLIIEDMRNAIVDRISELAERTNSVPTPSDTYILYETIRESAPARRLILDLFAFKKTDNLVATHPDEWYPQFLRELVCKLKRPGQTALSRHDIRPWKPGTWQTTKACTVCLEVQRPQMPSNMCVNCKKTFCCNCVSRGEGSGSLDWALAERDCKPWIRDICAYHEHLDVSAHSCRKRRLVIPSDT